VAKGIEISTGMRPSQVVAELLPESNYSILSGPSHAEEIMTDSPAAVVVAGPSREAKAWQTYFMTPRFRVYTSEDVIGVEAGAAVKNVIAIGTGIARAMGQGDNAVAALVTRGLAEIMRLGARMGANPLTLSGLAGVGDLMVTCYSMHSRNFRLGLELGRGVPFREAVDNLGEVAEGAYTVRALVDHARSLDVEIPICRAVHRVIYEGADPKQAMSDLLLRSPKPEFPAMFWS
jgi:glycerol-3-phosphate dehydrogenase (NAD(P)+)